MRYIMATCQLSIISLQLLIINEQFTREKLEAWEPIISEVTNKHGDQKEIRLKVP